jgi:fibronectin type 3 domain-containing protein
MFAYEGTVKKWGGHILTNLNESEQSISLSMHPVVTNFSATTGSTEVDLSWYEVTGVSGYRVYRADYEYGPYQLIGTCTPSTNYFYYDFSGAPGVYYYYSISVFNPTWEGEKCDPKRARRM